MNSPARDEKAVAACAEFVRICENEWKLSQQLPPTRRERLKNSPPYGQIVDGLVRPIALVRVARERSRGVPGHFRAVIRLRVRATAFDLFYNSASGYRAQYYHAADLGTLANRFALDRLLPHILRSVTSVNKRICPPAWVEKSLRDPDAKLWPHQGVWLRYARRTDQNFLVDRWLARQSDPDKKLRKKAKRSMLTPFESLLELKGAFLSPLGKPLGTFKATRSKDIHELGYT
jgi:hypothetical protein